MSPRIDDAWRALRVRLRGYAIWIFFVYNQMNVLEYLINSNSVIQLLLDSLRAYTNLYCFSRYNMFDKLKSSKDDTCTVHDLSESESSIK